MKCACSPQDRCIIAIDCTLSLRFRQDSRAAGAEEANSFAASLRNGLTGASSEVLADAASEAACAIMSVAAGSTAGGQDSHDETERRKG